MARELARRTRELLPKVKLVQVHGLSETGYLTGLQDQEHTDERLTSCGWPAPGVEVQVADESGKEVQAGQRGELVARGENLMRGYWNDPEDTAAALRHHLFSSPVRRLHHPDRDVLLPARPKDTHVIHPRTPHSLTRPD